MVDRWNEKYKAIACELVEQLAKHGLTVEESCFVLDYSKAMYERAGNLTVPDPALLRRECLKP